MPKRAKGLARPLPTGARVAARWMVYSTNREHCFKEEIASGYFGPNHSCGCKWCDKQLKLPMPIFTQLPGEVR